MTAALLHRQAENVAAGLPPLLMRAKRAAATVAAGMHGWRRPGKGDDFWQFRHSQPGDSLTAIDWRQSGKSDHLYVRESEWAIAHTTRFWVDPSASMRWRSHSALDSKYERSALLAVAVGFLLEQAGERIGLIGQSAPAFFGRTGPARLAAALLNAPIAGGLPEAAVKARSTVLILSDFLMPLPDIAQQTQRWMAAGLNGHLVQILDPAEEALPYHGRIRMHGLEEEGDLLLPHAESLQAPYRQAMSDHRRGLATIARQAGWRFTLHHTDQPARAALTHIYAALSR